MTPLIDAYSWSLAASISRAFPDWRIFHTHPGGGQYDCLSMVDRVDEPAVRITINRRGSIHAQSQTTTGEMIGFSDSQWVDSLIQGARPQDLAKSLLSQLQVAWPTRTPSTTRWSLTHQILARIVMTTSGTGYPLGATTWWFDSSGDDDSFLLMPTPHRELEQIPPSDVWLVMKEDSAVGWLWNGWVWTATHERLDLYARYRRGASVDASTAMILDSARRDSSGCDFWSSVDPRR